MQTHTDAPKPEPARVLTERDAARYLAVSIYSMRVWRVAGRGPDFIRFGRLVRYNLDALDRYLAEHTIRRRVA